MKMWQTILIISAIIVNVALVGIAPITGALAGFIYDTVKYKSNGLFIGLVIGFLSSVSLVLISGVIWAVVLIIMYGV